HAPPPPASGYPRPRPTHGKARRRAGRRWPGGSGALGGLLTSPVVVTSFQQEGSTYHSGCQSCVSGRLRRCELLAVRDEVVTAARTYLCRDASGSDEHGSGSP